MTPAQVKPPISAELLDQIDIRVGTIESVSEVANSEKLVTLRVNFGDHVRAHGLGWNEGRACQPSRDRRQASAIRCKPSTTQNGRDGFGSHAVRHRLCGWDYPSAGGAGIQSAGRNQSRVTTTGLI